MPSPNTLKERSPGGTYHVFNRGVERRSVFYDERDYAFFLYLLRRALMPASAGRSRETHLVFHGKIRLLAFCLMDNHFHLLLAQVGSQDMTGFMRSVANAYVRYFNGRHTRVGPLFQSRYKARLLETDADLLGVSRYIHQNPTATGVNDWEDYPYSSLPAYLGKKTYPWISTEPIKVHFRDHKDYSAFVREGVAFDAPERDLAIA